MASNYWIKLYHEILDDPKMGRLPDNLWRRFIECCLLAGDLQMDGRLPPMHDIAWRLRVEEETLRGEFDHMARIGLVDFVATPLDEHWIVTKFADRQAAIPAAERMRLMRNTKKKRKYYGSSDTYVTKRNTEEEVDIDKEEEVETDFPPASSATFSQESIQEGQARRLLEGVCGILTKDAPKYFATVEDMITEYGQDDTKSAIKKAREKWISTPRKNGTGYYSATNYGFIDWAVAYLDGHAPWGEVIKIDPYQKIVDELERQARNG